ncbi:OLC1v1010097C1 [Oldenlandia corymbosa var. corymbosa]|uniref:OLC1v1010097C1 n=1 Tax=Oldenlandia corymbosa var. corymbosa TaxID=529605 RepID=A0AAV1DQJ0_OLDCO|nr:OLC1v1010097C1 [Oldenlandia corymbosa var. corymbosa]
MFVLLINFIQSSFVCFVIISAVTWNSVKHYAVKYDAMREALNGKKAYLLHAAIELDELLKRINRKLCRAAKRNDNSHVIKEIVNAHPVIMDYMVRHLDLISSQASEMSSSATLILKSLRKASADDEEAQQKLVKLTSFQELLEDFVEKANALGVTKAELAHREKELETYKNAGMKNCHLIKEKFHHEFERAEVLMPENAIMDVGLFRVHRNGEGVVVVSAVPEASRPSHGYEKVKVAPPQPRVDAPLAVEQARNVPMEGAVTTGVVVAAALETRRQNVEEEG